MNNTSLLDANVNMEARRSYIANLRSRGMTSDNKMIRKHFLATSEPLYGRGNGYGFCLTASVKTSLASCIEAAALRFV